MCQTSFTAFFCDLLFINRFFSYCALQGESYPFSLFFL